jgi:hypothetical protein
MFLFATRRGAFAWLYGLATLGAGVMFAAAVIQNFHAPLLGNTDESLHSYQGYYFLTHLRLWPFLKLDLFNDALLFPYGNDQVFQPWVIERDLFSALCLKWFGHGPWVQAHYLIGLEISAIGLFLLLRREHSPLRAAFAGLAITFCNFYPIAKFPGHANISAMHWTALGLAADCLLARRFARGEPIPARLAALRGVLLLLTLGQDMGYVAGLSLTSFVVTVLWIVFLAWRSGRLAPCFDRARLRGAIGKMGAEFRAHPAQTALLALGGAWGAFLYFPLALQVALHTRKFPVGQLQADQWWQWASPWRIFIPILPGVEPVSSPGNYEILAKFFGDMPEGFFAFSPGLFFVLFGGLGVFMAIRRRTIAGLMPLIVCWLLVLAYHPDSFPVLRIFPWFSFVRVSAKLGGIHCVALTLMGIGGIPAGFFYRRRRFSLWIGGGLAALLISETATAYRLNLTRPKALLVPDAGFCHFMQTIRSAKGSAVLEWPFCIASGNGFGTRKMGLYYTRECSLFALSQFHGKKVMSGYFGRLHPKQYESFVKIGWPNLFFPDDPEPRLAQRQTRDFLPYEWEFFERFFQLNDFCGLLLCPDLLPRETVSQMHARFGPPLAETHYGKAGRLEFIPRPAAWRGMVDPKAGKSLALAAPLRFPVTRIDLTDDASAMKYLRDGWSGAESKGRYSDAKAAALVFHLDAVPDRALTVDFFAKTYKRQAFSISLNGRSVQGWEHDGMSTRAFHAELPPALLRAGANRLVFHLPKAHSPASEGENDDIRQLGLRMTWLEIRQTPPP